MKIKIFTLAGLALTVLAVGSCNLDINTDPYAVTALDVNQLLTATEYENAATFSEGYYLNANFSSYVHHTVSREIDNYALDAGYSTLGNTWSQAYRYAIKNAQELYDSGKENENEIYAGIGLLLKAYTYMNLVDLWGDVPYSEALVASIEEPKCDPSADVYNNILKDINEAIGLFTSAKGDNPGAADLFYTGDSAKWLKAANTLKLKLLVQSRLAKSMITDWSSELSALLSADNFLSDGEDLQFPHSTAVTPSDERKFGFVDEYEGSQKSVWISPWLYEVMNGKTYNFTANPFAGIVDPRTKYYYYNQSSASDDALNKTDYRDGAFISIMFGSNSGYTSGTQEEAMTVIGIYPVGGKYDDGSAKAIDAKSGNGVAPDKMIQAYSVPFLKAELVLAGEATGDAKALLKEGIESSIYHVNEVSKASDSSVPTITKDAMDEFTDAILERFDEGDSAKKLEIVMTQKWVANFYNSVEAYNDIRRTGYPVLFKGDSDNKGWTPYAQEVEATPGLSSFDLVSILKFPRIMWYPQSEVTSNPNVTNAGRVVSDPKVFWDIH